MSQFITVTRFGPSGPRLAVFNEIVSSDFETAYVNASIRKPFRKYGHSGTITNGTSRDIWHGSSALYPGWLTAPERLRIKAGGNANDTANGTGARSVILEPHDANFVWQDDESVRLATNGASASAFTSGSFLRCVRAFVDTSGTYANGSNSGTNAGLITIETESGIEVAAIDVGDGQAEMSMFTVPAGYSLWLASVALQVDSGQAASLQMFYRERANVVTAPFSARRSAFTVTGVQGPSVIPLDYQLYFPEKTDLWWRATAGANNTTASAQYEGLLLSNS